MKKARILLVDDHQIVRKGLEMLLSIDQDIEIIGSVASGKEALDFINDNNVDIVVTDITMPEMTGIELIKTISETTPEIKNVVLSMHLDEDYIMEAMEYGAKGYIVKDSNEKDIISGLKRIVEGEVFLSKAASDVLAKTFINKTQKAHQQKEVQLTTRELEILKAIVDGMSNKMIGDQLNISELTVNTHRYNIMKKLKAKNSADLVRITFQKGLLD